MKCIKIVVCTICLWLGAINAVSAQVVDLGKLGELDVKDIFSKVMKIETVMPYQKISLFPNPVINKQFNVRLAGIRESGYNLRVINIKGQEIYQCKMSNTGAFTVQMVKLPSSVTPGIYNLVITGSDYQENKMFIVQ